MRDTASELGHLNASTGTDHAHLGPTRDSARDPRARTWLLPSIAYSPAPKRPLVGPHIAATARKSSASLRFTARHVRIARQPFPHPTVLLPGSTRTLRASSSRSRDASGVPASGVGPCRTGVAGSLKWSPFVTRIRKHGGLAVVFEVGAVRRPLMHDCSVAVRRPPELRTLTS